MGWSDIRFSTRAACIAGGVAGMLVLGVWAGEPVPPAPGSTKAQPPAKDAGSKQSAFVQATRNAQRVAETPVPVITNSDLEKVAANQPPKKPQAPGAVEPTASAAGDPDAGGEPAEAEASEESALVRLERERKESGERGLKMQQAEQDLAAAQKNLADLEVQLLAAKNPFARRPELSDKEKQIRAESQENAAERVARTQKLVDDARIAVTAAEQRLAAARAGS